jgi:hypothetical protein
MERQDGLLMARQRAASICPRRRSQGRNENVPAELSDDAQRLIAVASVLEVTFSVDDIADALGVSVVQRRSPGSPTRSARHRG